MNCSSCGEDFENGSLHQLIDRVDCDGCDMQAHKKLVRVVEELKQNRDEIAASVKAYQEEHINLLDKIEKLTKERDEQALCYQNTLRTWNDTLNILSETMVREKKTEAAKDLAYSERNHLVGALSKVFPSHLMLHDGKDESWESDWRNIVCIELPSGQCTWHIHDSEVHLFAHLDHRLNNWDGHDTLEKYKRIDALTTVAPEAEKYKIIDGQTFEV